MFKESERLTVAASRERKPAPTKAWMSVIGKVKSVGTPFNSGSLLKDKWVLSMQTGKFPKPFRKRIIKMKQNSLEITYTDSNFHIYYPSP